MSDPVTFSPSIVCQALNIPPGTLAAWAARGRFTGFDAAKTSQGRARQFSLADALALSLIKVASDRGIERPELLSFVRSAALEWLRHPKAVRELSLFDYPAPNGGTDLRYNDSVMKSKPAPGWTDRITFNLTDIFSRAQTALSFLNAGEADGETGEWLPG